MNIKKLVTGQEIPEAVQQVIAGVEGLALEAEDFQTVQITQVESEYYDWSLEQRRDRLKAPSIDHLCKTLVFENTRQKLLDDVEDLLDQRHPKYVIVLIQYTDKMSTKKLNGIMREELLKRTGISQGNKFFNMRLAPEQVAIELTGYGNNGVSPFGMTRKNLRIVMSEKIAALNPAQMFLGAGDVDFKIQFPIAAFIQKSFCLVKDISE
jgi:prolyl-tRNA editing enzyme YbaK/EbsC (Cys-tRNA(Pro) deacylase)